MGRVSWVTEKKDVASSVIRQNISAFQRHPEQQQNRTFCLRMELEKQRPFFTLSLAALI
jgi:hypothetical protein